MQALRGFEEATEVEKIGLNLLLGGKANLSFYTSLTELKQDLTKYTEINVSFTPVIVRSVIRSVA